MTRTTTISAVAGVGVVLASALALAGCSPTNVPADTTPTVVDTPRIDWQNGAPSETDLYVQAARAADLGTVLAWNAHDFTIEQLSSTVTPGLAAFYFERFEPVERRAYPGPRPSTVVEVTENAAGDGALVVLCRVSEDWRVSVEHPQPEVDLTTGTETTYTVISSESGDLVVSNVEASGAVCDASSASVGYFWPTPNVPDLAETEDVRAPIGYVAD